MQRQLWSADAEPAIFAWCDSTDLAGYQILFSRSVRILPHKLIPALHDFWKVSRDAVHLQQDVELENRRQQRYSLGLIDSEEEIEEEIELEWPVSEGPPPERLSTAERKATFKRLQDAVIPHVGLPSCLGLGHTSVSAKVSALMYSCALEASDFHQLARINRRVHCMCTDMGTELGIPSFHTQLADTLPTWHAWHGSRPRFVPDTAGVKDNHITNLFTPTSLSNSFSFLGLKVVAKLRFLIKTVAKLHFCADLGITENWVVCG